MSTASATVSDAKPSLLSDLIALSKPRLSALVLFTSGAGMWLAPEVPAPWRFALSLIGVSGTVAAANTLNNWIERDIDRNMARTADRPLPTGRLPAWAALTQGVVLAAISLPLLFLVANPLTAGLGLLSLVLYVFVYTPMKRTSTMSVVVGAIPGAMPPLMGWTTATGHIDAGGLVLFGILFFWQIPHFLAIGMYRKKEYADAGLMVMSNVSGDESTRRHIVAYATALVLVSLLAVPTGVGGLLTGAAALALGAGFWWRSITGLRTRGDAVWARALFLYSLVYLSGLFATMALDKLV